MRLQTIVDQLKEDEGFSPLSFWDNEQWTWGYGTKAPGPGLGIDKETAEADLIRRTCQSITEFEDIFRGFQMSEVRQHALVNMLFNLGRTKFLNFKNTLASIMRSDWEDASIRAAQSLWYRQVGKRAVRIVRELKEG